MKLTHELRNLEGRKLLHRDRRLKSACHEAAHALYALRHGIAFLEVRVGQETITSNLHSDNLKCESVDVAGRLVADPAYQYFRSSVYPIGHGWDDAAKLSLAGHEFERIVNPHHNDLYLMFTGSMNDYRQALEMTKWGLFAEEYGLDGREVERVIDKELIPAVRQFLLKNWDVVMRIGQRLSEAGELDYEQVKTLGAGA
jgi:hypothetical protein